MKLIVWVLLVVASCLQLTSVTAREQEFPAVKNSLIQASGGQWNGRFGKWIPRPDTNLAHMYPYNAMEYVVRDALDKWPIPSKSQYDIDHEAPARLLAFLDWLFLIDPQAVVNKDFHDAVPIGTHILHSVYLDNHAAGLVAENEVLKNAAKRKIAIDPAQLWRFDGDYLINKDEANWQFSTVKLEFRSPDRDVNKGYLMDKDRARSYYQLTRPTEMDLSEGARLSLTNWQRSWELWKKSRPITLERDPNQWFTLYNIKSKRYLTAGSPRSTQIQAIVRVDVAVNSPWFKTLMQYCTSAPANLRYGEEWTNGLVSNWLDPMGDASGNPTAKECEGALRLESFKLSSTPKRRRTDPDIMFSSTGSIKSKERISSGTYDYYANSVTTLCANYGEWGHYLATKP